MARKLAVLGLAALLGTAAAGSVELNQENFETNVFNSGKHAFVKFQAPWSVTSPNKSPESERERARARERVTETQAASWIPGSPRH
jgi:hypothetical protein